MNVATGAEVLPGTDGKYAIGPYSASLVSGALIDVTTGRPLPIVGNAIVDEAGKPIVMVSTWSRIACPPGVTLGGTGPTGPTGPQGPAGASGQPGATGATVVVSGQPQVKDLLPKRKKKRGKVKAVRTVPKVAVAG